MEEYPGKHDVACECSASPKYQALFVIATLRNKNLGMLWAANFWLLLNVKLLFKFKNNYCNLYMTS